MLLQHLIKDGLKITSIIPPSTTHTDADNNGVPDNPGNILYYQENYSGNKDSLGLNFGFAFTFNIPLDNRFQDSCLDAANTYKTTKTRIKCKDA